MFPAYARSVQFFRLLHQIDLQNARAKAAAGCPYCKAPLHRADYPRKARGAPDGLENHLLRRFSFSCSREGCRRRLTPPSLRFLGRRVYFALTFVLVSVLSHGITPRRRKALREFVDLDRRTLKRWQRFWADNFTGSAFWRDLRARFCKPVDESRLPASWIERMGGEASVKLLKVLRLLANYPNPPDHDI